jgi:hypothetical protein
MGETRKYYQGKTITTIRDMANSSKSEIDDFLTPSRIFRVLAM